MSKPIHSCLAVACAVLLTLALSTPSVRASTLGEKWQVADDEAVRLILAGQYDKAKKKLDQILEEMHNRLGPGVGGKQAMGLVLMHRALAQAGRGARRDALWDWHVALNFNPRLLDEDLSQLGDPGNYLRRNPLRTLRQHESGSTDEDGDQGPYLILGRVDPPKVRKRPQPSFPRGASYFKVEGPIVLQLIITKEGEAIQPVILRDLDVATLSFSALEAVRRWKFSPAHLDAEPVPVFYNMTVNYHLRPTHR